MLVTVVATYLTARVVTCGPRRLRKLRTGWIFKQNWPGERMDLGMGQKVGQQHGESLALPGEKKQWRMHLQRWTGSCV